MKTQIKKYAVTFTLCLQACFTMIGCGQNGSSGSTAAAAPTTNNCTYTNGQYYSNGVPTTNCNNLNGFNNNNVNVSATMQCYGMYATVQGISGQGMCYDTNCAGYILRNLQTNQIVQCVP